MTETARGPISAFAMRDEEIERMLATGENRSALEDYFGPEQLRELEGLARESMRRRRGGPRVLILPGIMGSKLGRRRKLFLDDVIWIDPVEAVSGGIVRLALPDREKIEALGVILFAYLKLKLRLSIAGFDADFFPFDWRQSLRALGGELARRIASESAPVRLVAHSMGGLVARAALKDAAASKNVSSLIMLGTPNYGSFAPVQALRAENTMAEALAAVDLEHSAEELATRVFATLPGLHEMLPSPERWKGIDLYRAASWPSDKPKPKQSLLTSARDTQAKALAAPDERFVLIAGVNQDTFVDFVVEDGKGRYVSSRDGDGTVPLALAELPDTKTYYVEESHGSLPNNSSVEAAVVDLLRDGSTDRLPRTWTRVRAREAAAPVEVKAVSPFEGRRGRALSSLDRRRILEPFASAASRDALALAAAAPPTAMRAEAPSRDMSHSIKNVEVTRRRAHALEICLGRGSVTEARVRALALGIFRGVDPSGAAAAVDRRLEGAIREAVGRRMFSAEVGSVFVIPTGRHLLYADSVLFAGLGPFDTFQNDVQQFVAENMMRTFVRAHVEDFATVLFGASSGWSVPTVLANQLSGFVRGLLDSDNEHRMRRITFCEADPDRYQEMKEELYRLASTDLFGSLVVTFDETILGEAPEAVRERALAPARLAEKADVTYLIVSREENPEPRAERSSRSIFRASVLTHGDKATVVSGSRDVRADALAALLRRIEAEQISEAQLRRIGEDLAQLVLDPTVARITREVNDLNQDAADDRKSHLVVVHDASSSQLPWETLCIDGWFPALAGGISRRYAAENLSAAKWLEQRRIDKTIDVLLISNPTNDLPGADAEGTLIRDSFPPGTALRIAKELHGERATRDAVLAELGSGKYDVVHYAGHAFFDPEQRSRSGILCHGDQVLSGAQLAELRNLPALAFFNACESARTRGRRVRRHDRDPRLRAKDRIERNVGLAEAFLRGGIANYVGTYWPVGDDAAMAFARAFYAQLIEAKSIGAAIQEGRKAVKALRSIDWADYVHYGPYDFQLKRASD